MHSSRSASVGLGDELGRARADHVHAEDLVVLLLGDDLHEAFDLVGDAGAGQDAELERADLHVVAALARLPLGQADAADLRIAVGAAGHLVVVDGPELLAGDPFGERDALGRRQMRELRVPRLVERDDVADRGDAGHAGLEPLVDVHVAALEPQARLLGAEAGRHRAAAGRDEQILGARASRRAVGASAPPARRRSRRPWRAVTFVPVMTLMPCA